MARKQGNITKKQSEKVSNKMNVNFFDKYSNLIKITTLLFGKSAALLIVATILCVEDEIVAGETNVHELL